MDLSLTILNNTAEENKFSFQTILLIVLFIVCCIGVGVYKATSIDDTGEKPLQVERPKFSPKDEPIPIAKPDTDDDTKRKYVTYTKYNPLTKQYYVGKSSGFGTPQQIVKRREYGHHRNAEGYLSAILDRWAFDRRSIRGREQQIVDLFGGAWSEVGFANTQSGNRVRAVSKLNPLTRVYYLTAIKEFGYPSKEEIITKHKEIK